MGCLQRSILLGLTANADTGYKLVTGHKMSGLLYKLRNRSFLFLHRMCTSLVSSFQRIRPQEAKAIYRKQHTSGSIAEGRLFKPPARLRIVLLQLRGLWHKRQAAGQAQAVRAQESSCCSHGPAQTWVESC